MASYRIKTSEQIFQQKLKHCLGSSLSQSKLPAILIPQVEQDSLYAQRRQQQVCKNARPEISRVANICKFLFSKDSFTSM